MSQTLTKVVVNCADGSSQEIPLSAEEIAQRDADALAWQEAEAARLAAQVATDALKASAKAKLIAGTPLTEAEASVLIG
jgi:hypothetical protein